MTPRTQLRRLTRRLLRWGRLGLCISLAFMLSMDPNLVCRQLAVAQVKAEIEAQQEAEFKELADKLEKLFDALEEAQQQIPRETFDPKVIIEGQPEVGFKGVGTDPEKIFEWVRDNTYLVPYRGVLRDYKGVLMDRVGNSLDRALLLFVLLRQAGHKKVQLAFAELSDDKAAELLDKARPIPKEGALPRSEVSADELSAQLQQYAAKYDINLAELRQTMDLMNLKSQRLAEEAVTRTLEQSGRPAEMLEARGLVPSRDDQIATLRSDAIESLKHHWWVQLQSEGSGGGFFGGGGKIADYDPSLKDAQPGKPFVEMQSYVPGNKLTAHLRNEMHTVQFRIIIERWENGKLIESPVLSEELFPAAFIGERIAIHHAPAPGNWPEDLNLFEAEKPVEMLKRTVLQQREWVPVLSVGGSTKFELREKNQKPSAGTFST